MRRASSLFFGDHLKTTVCCEELSGTRELICSFRKTSRTRFPRDGVRVWAIRSRATPWRVPRGSQWPKDKAPPNRRGLPPA